jgi:hypothetical protein
MALALEINLKFLANAVKIGSAGGFFRRPPSTRQGRQQQTNQQRYNADHHQEFYKRKTVTVDGHRYTPFVFRRSHPAVTRATGRVTTENRLQSTHLYALSNSILTLYVMIPSDHGYKGLKQGLLSQG